MRNQLRPAWASRLRSVLTDKAYQGRFARQALGWQHHVASRPPTTGRGFVPVAKRWVVERTVAQLLSPRGHGLRAPAGEPCGLVIRR